MDKNLIGALVFALLGLGLLAPGLYSLATTARQYFSLESTSGVVVEIRVRPAVKTGGTEMRSPVVRFTAGDGQEHVVHAARGYSRSPFSEGDTVAVRYDRANPDNAMIDSFFEVWGLGALLSGFGAVCLLAGWLAYQRVR